MHILIVSHSCATAINQEIYARIRLETGWKTKLAVLRQLCAQPDHHKTMGVNACKRVEENYTCNRIILMAEDAQRESMLS